jgi:hypothetical protein
MRDLRYEWTVDQVELQQGKQQVAAIRQTRIAHSLDAHSCPKYDNNSVWLHSLD